MHNLTGDAEYADVQARHRRLVREWWERTDGDEEAWTRPVEG
jgi:hypothetical protein